jgi:hypothetical protein
MSNILIVDTYLQIFHIGFDEIDIILVNNLGQIRTAFDRTLGTRKINIL